MLFGFGKFWANLVLGKDNNFLDLFGVELDYLEMFLILEEEILLYKDRINLDRFFKQRHQILKTFENSTSFEPSLLAEYDNLY